MANIPFLNNAYFAGKVGIGTASPGYKLDVSGTGQIISRIISTDNSGARFDLHSSGGGRYSQQALANGDFFMYDETSGHPIQRYFDGASGAWAWYTVGTERMRINSSGNVGIGETSVDARLHISALASNGISNVKLESPGASKWAFGIPAGQTYFALDDVNDNLTTPKLVVLKTSGNVGIGTYRPNEKLQVGGNIHIWDREGGTDGALYVTRGSTNTTFAKISSNGISYLNGGNVGIGTTSPISKFTVTGTDNTNQANIGHSTQSVFIKVNGTNVDYNASGNSSGSHTFSTGNTERMRITAAGILMVGGTTGGYSGTKIHVGNFTDTQNGINILTSTTGYGYVLFGDGTGADTYRGQITYYHGDDSMSFNTNGSEKLRIVSGGGISFAGATNFGSAGQVLKSNGSASPAWVDASTVIGGPYLPLAGGTMTGDLKLNDNVDLYLGTGNDFQAYHDGSNTYLRNLNGSFIIKQDRVDEDLIFESDNGSGGTTEYFRLDGGSTMNVFSKPTWYGDGVKALFGNSSDLQIYHDGSNSYIKDAGAGSLKILAQDFDLNNAAETASMIRAIDGAQVELYYGGSKKLETTSTGIAITGNLDSPQISVNDYISHNGDTDTYFGFPAANEFKLVAGGSNKFAADANAAYMYYQGGAKFQTTNTGVTVTGAATATTFLGDLNGTINTATTAVTKANATNDTTVATTAFVQNLIGTIPAGLVFQGTWNAATNTPTLTSGSGTTGHFYIVSTDGSTNLDGITDWKVGDWAVFVEQGASDQWEKVDNSSVLDGAGTGQKVSMWSGSGTSNTLTDAPITVSGNNTTFAGNVLLDDGTLTVGADAAGRDVIFRGGTSGAYFMYDASEDGVVIVAPTDEVALGIRVVGGGQPTVPQFQVGRGISQYLGIKVDDRISSVIHRQDETTGVMQMNQEIWDNGTGIHLWNWKSYNGSGSSGSTKMTLNKTGELNVSTSVTSTTFLGDLNGTINTVTTGVTQTAGNNSTLIATTAYADAAAAAVPIGNYLPLAGGTMTGVTQFNDHTQHGDQVSAKWGAGNDLTIQHNATNSAIANSVGNLYISNHADDKDIIFECDNGSGASVSYLTLDGSTTHAYFSNPGNVGIGTTSPGAKLHVQGTSFFFDQAIFDDKVGIGTTSPVYKLDVNGGARAGGVVTYSKYAGSLTTTGYAVAGLTSSSNGNSTGFTFTCFGHTGGYQKIVYSCRNETGTWKTSKVINEGTNDFDVEASADGTTITFTFKSTSGTKFYSPRVTIEATGHSINSTYA